MENDLIDQYRPMIDALIRAVFPPEIEIRL
jgi:hypothetical protein